jgi:carboxylesterase type B
LTTSSENFAYPGIPYAEPPVGALRLRPPQLKSRLNVTTFNAGDYGKTCIQPVRLALVQSVYLSDGEKVAEPSTMSEDCLTINLHRPAGLSPSAKLPVVSCCLSDILERIEINKLAVLVILDVCSCQHLSEIYALFIVLT